MKKSEYLYISVFALYLGVLLYLCLGKVGNSGLDLPERLFGIPIDKAAHFIMFLPVVPIIYPVLFSWKFSTDGRIFRTTWVVVSIFVATIIAGSTEILQLLATDYRSADIYDFYADIAGIAAGSIAGLPLAKKFYSYIM